jgi:hypothetical protein
MRLFRRLPRQPEIFLSAGARASWSARSWTALTPDRRSNHAASKPKKAGKAHGVRLAIRWSNPGAPCAGTAGATAFRNRLRNRKKHYL